MLLLAFAAAGQGPAGGGPEGAEPAGPAEPVAIYGLELDERGGRERLLVFADHPVAYRVSEPNDATVELRIAGAVLDRTAPTQVASRSFRALLSATASARETPSGPEVRIEIERAPGVPAEVSQRGSLLAVEFPRPALGKGAGIALDLRDAELAEVVGVVAAGTGEAFLFDETLRGRVTLAIGERVSPQAAREILDTALLLGGYAALPTPGGPYKILPIENANEAAPWRRDPAEGGGEAPVVTRLRLHAAHAEVVLAALQPLLGSSVLVSPHLESNSLILAGPEERLRRLLWIAHNLDSAERVPVRLRRLRFASAERAAEMLDRALGPDPGARGRYRILTDARTNALAILADAATAAQIDDLLERIDRPQETRGVLEAVRLRHADPEALAKLLTELAAGSARPDAPPGIADTLFGLDFRLAVDRPTRSLLVSAAPDTLAALRDVIADLDRPPRRVRVQVTVMEVMTSESLELGFDFFAPFAIPKSTTDAFGAVLSNPSGGGLFEPGSGSGTGPAFGARYTRAPLVLPIVGPLGIPLTLLIPRDSAVLTAEGREVYMRTLARPDLLMVSGEDQEIFAGNNVPILSSQATEATALQTSQNVERRDVGLRLRLRPVLGQAGGVRLALELEASALAPSLTGDVQAVGPTLLQRQLSGVVHLRDGEVAVVGGAREAVRSSHRRGAPFLQSVPVLGQFFRSDRDSAEPLARELVVAVQAQVLRDPDTVVVDSLRRRVAFERALARQSELRRLVAEPYALIVGTRGVRAEAEDLAARVRGAGFQAVVVAWQDAGEPRFDVYATGYATLADVGEASLRLRAAGFRGELAVLPPDAPH